MIEYDQDSFIYLLWKFGSNIIFPINQVWEANKPAKGEIKKKE